MIIKNKYLSCLSAALFFLYIIFQMTVFNSSSGYLAEHFGLSQMAIGNISSLYFYFAAFSLIPYGLLLDHSPTRKPSLIIMTLCVASVLMLAAYPSSTTAGLYRIICGLTNPLIFLVCMRQAPSWFPRNTSLAISLIITIGMLGGMLQYPFSLIMEHLSWQNALLMDAALGAILLSFGFTCLKDQPLEKMPHLGLKGLFTHLRSALAIKENWFCGLFTAFLNLPVMVLAAIWGDQYLMMNQGISQSEASLVISMIFFGMIFASPFFGWFADACQSRKKAMVIGATASIIVILVIMLLPHVGLPVLAALFFLLGFTFTSQIISYTVVNEINQLKRASTAMSFVSILIYLIGGLGNPAFGAVSSFFLERGESSAFASEMAILLLPIAFMLALISIFFIRETFGRAND